MWVIDDKYGRSHPERLTGYLEEGRLALIELLGRLASYYRDRYLSSRDDPRLPPEPGGSR
jgi:hypothetical protein